MLGKFRGALWVLSVEVGYCKKLAFDKLILFSTGLKLNVCKGPDRNKTCTQNDQKVSYAIPLEIIYLTPLNNWNPHNLTYKGDERLDHGKTVTADGRNGGKTKTKAYDGVNSKIYYITPNRFFTGNETNVDAADTTKDLVGVLDPTGEVRQVRASGVRIFLPDIPGVGILRQRYPIMPIHVEGSTAWKEIQAVGDFLMESKKHANLFRDPLSGQDGGQYPPEVNTDTDLRTGSSTNLTKVGRHRHEVILDKDEVTIIKSGGNVTVVTTENSGHQHTVTIKWHKKKGFYMALCDSTEITRPFAVKCWDKHSARMAAVPNE
ncbi:Hypothetical predicted protein [Paramuricea clavata]|uniref:Uncharacterized protein n=1 Tax=Paramuricea clavata TaxID=317549 RepID=A0A6S7JCT1_PARCT|nr:Hypothetical predicted protein [Paramuricea clavata]